MLDKFITLVFGIHLDFKFFLVAKFPQSFVISFKTKISS